MLRALALVGIAALLGVGLALNITAEGHASPWAYEDPRPTPTTEVREDSLSIGAEYTTPDKPASESEAERTIAWSPPPGIPSWVTPAQRCVASADDAYAMDCTATPPAQPTAPGTTTTAPGTPGVTIRDIATFRPEPATLNAEPAGWALRGLAANFYTTGGNSTRTGTLLGTSAEVRFTPVAWQFDYGDATAPRHSSTPGATWQALGLDEFDDTATSHVYDTAGSYTVTVLVDYTAEYRLGGAGAFTPIPGTLAIASTPIQMIVADHASTALVDHNCLENPHGVGC